MFSNALLKTKELGNQEVSLIQVSGLSYRQTDVELRERFTVTAETHRQTLEHLKSIPGVQEAVVISTCNRTEIVTALPEEQYPQGFAENLLGVFETLSGLHRKKFAEQLYHLQKQDAVAHIFRVASGLDSMILGEPQVLGQLKSAYHFAKSYGTTHLMLNRLFHRAFPFVRI